MRKTLLLCVHLGLAACSAPTPARDQWLVAVDSDAPVPLVGDRLLIEVLDEQGDTLCEPCRRQFGLSPSEPWPVSFGIDAEGIATRPLVRARLYRVSNTDADGLPLPLTTLDAVVELPEASGVTEATLQLEMPCLGIPSNLERFETCDPSSGELRPIERAREPRDLKPWDPNLNEECAGSRPEDALCVPSGAFVQGDVDQVVIFEEGLAQPERVVVLSAFFMDVDEFRVGQLRELRREFPELGEPTPYDPESAQYCTYLGPDNDSNDAMAVNCVSHVLATELCSARGMRLPTEAEWEFAAGNRERETRYPWGNDEADPCQSALHGLGSVLDGSSYCRWLRPNDDQAAGPRAETPERDRTELGIVNLAGGMAEWTADRLVPYSDGCWGQGPWLTNPICSSPDLPFVVRGSAWDASLHEGSSTARDGAAGGANDGLGFRCAADGAD